MRHVEIILKVTERCNLNCRYCYFFNKENQDFLENPALIPVETVQHLVRFLRTCPQLSETIFQIDFHGGEPLLLGHQRLSEIASMIASGLSNAKEVRFSIQTNALLVNDAWLDVFGRHQMSVGISIDGPQSVHDKFRVDHRGKPTFARMAPKIAAVARAVASGRIPKMGAICVISPESSARDTYQCLTEELGFSHLQFQFPDQTHDAIDPDHLESFKRFVEELFDCWEKHDPKNVRVQLLDRTFQALLRIPGKPKRDAHATDEDENIVLTISSAGAIGHDDTLRNELPELFRSGMNVSTANFADVLRWYMTVSRTLGWPGDAMECRTCGWQTICAHVTRGETPLHRMKTGSMNNASVYCETLKALYLKGAIFLASRGVAVSTLTSNLAHPVPICSK